ncbi:hypothetical protein CsSME_00026865 [Camellia sinensis var. sinensis]
MFFLFINFLNVFIQAQDTSLHKIHHCPSKNLFLQMGIPDSFKNPLKKAF